MNSGMLSCNSTTPYKFTAINNETGTKISANNNVCDDDGTITSCLNKNINFDFYIEKASNTNPNMIFMKNLQTNKYCHSTLDPINKINPFVCDSEQQNPLYISEYIPPPMCDPIKCQVALSNAYKYGTSINNLYNIDSECQGCPLPKL